MMSKSKVISTKALPMIKAGSSSGSKDARSNTKDYAKGSSVNMSPNWNPQKLPASQYGLKGV